MHGDEFGSVREGSFHLDFRDHFGDSFHDVIKREYRRAKAHQFGDSLSVADLLEQFRRDQRNGFGIIELQAAVFALPREFAGREDHEFIDFAWCEVHQSYKRPRLNNTSVTDKSPTIFVGHSDELLTKTSLPVSHLKVRPGLAW